jgi:hypothetical protein
MECEGRRGGLDGRRWSMIGKGECEVGGEWSMMGEGEREVGGG